MFDKKIKNENYILKAQLEETSSTIGELRSLINELAEKKQKYIVIEPLDLNSQDAKLELYKIGTNKYFKFFWMSLRDSIIDVLTKTTTEKEINKILGFLSCLDAIRDKFEKINMDNNK